MAPGNALELPILRYLRRNETPSASSTAPFLSKGVVRCRDDVENHG